MSDMTTPNPRLSIKKERIVNRKRKSKYDHLVRYSSNLIKRAPDT